MQRDKVNITGECRFIGTLEVELDSSEWMIRKWKQRADGERKFGREREERNRLMEQLSHGFCLPCFISRTEEACFREEAEERTSELEGSEEAKERGFP